MSRAVDYKLDVENTNVTTYAKGIRRTRLFNSLSLLFPVGERFFIDSIRYYEDKLTPELLEEAKLFYKEEGVHSREHRKLNNLLKEAGYDVDSLEQSVKRKLALVGTTPENALLTTVCLEIFTAYGAELLVALRNGLLRNNSASNMWMWHAGEEMGDGHRSIAHKVLDHVSGVSKVRLVFWFIICTVLLLVQTAENYHELSKI